MQGPFSAAKKNLISLEHSFNHSSMTRTQTPIGKWECSRNEFNLTRIEPVCNGQRLNIFWKKSKKRNPEIACRKGYGEISECKNLKSI